MEADLDRYFGKDLRDHWRRDERGRVKLTLRQILVRVDSLPPDSASARSTGGSGWTINDYLLADVYAAWTGKQHPEDPRSVKNARKADKSALQAAYERHQERRERLGIKGSVLRKGE